MANADNVNVVLGGLNFGSISDLLLLEANHLWAKLKAGTPTYGADTLREEVERRLRTLPYDPVLKARVDAMLATKRGWGRNEFINGLYRLIGERYEIDVPYIEAKPRRT
ncbi:hypothetical protein J8I01_12935 [Aeromonas sanarellii]|uniref:Uncharacterized protein n=1 Tax=Aeromonas sanarellii TaxID=633415 RepID=A0ABS4B7X7_9GAMM|nr:hypothetical protein [Aeromonas sanarellii]MBP0603413.1 hypothetical protein [Aeromonas sanarellii]